MRRSASSFRSSLRIQSNGRVAILSVLVAALGIFTISSYSSSDAQSPANSADRPTSLEDTARFIEPGYQGLPLNSGVFGVSSLSGPGQAALWDLHLIDHYRYFGPEARARGYRPEQPIAFSHVTHVQKNNMDCQYCHWSVAKAAYAAIPEVEACMGCHAWVAGVTDFQTSEIKKIKEHYNSGTPIPWVKVHVMPAHVNFNHKRHVKAGVNCQECHGQVPNMPVVERVSSMKMGWCVECHRQRGTSIDCWTCHK